MANYGLETYDDAGRVILSISSRVPQVLGFFTVPEVSGNGNYKEGSVHDPRISKGDVFVVPADLGDHQSSDIDTSFDYWLSNGDTLNWKMTLINGEDVYSNNGNVSILECQFMYGVY